MDATTLHSDPRPTRRLRHSGITPGDPRPSHPLTAKGHVPLTRPCTYCTGYGTGAYERTWSWRTTTPDVAPAAWWSRATLPQRHRNRDGTPFQLPIMSSMCTLCTLVCTLSTFLRCRRLRCRRWSLQASCIAAIFPTMYPTALFSPLVGLQIARLSMALTL